MNDEVKLGIRIDSVLHHKIKIEAVARRISLKDLCIEYFEKGLNEFIESTAGDSILELNDSNNQTSEDVFEKDCNETVRIQDQDHEVGNQNCAKKGDNGNKVVIMDLHMASVVDLGVVNIIGYLDRSGMSESEYQSIRRVSGRYIQFEPLAILKTKHHLSRWIVLFEPNKEAPGIYRVESEEFILELEWKGGEYPPSGFWVNLSRKSTVVWAIDQTTFEEVVSTLNKWSVDHSSHF